MHSLKTIFVILQLKTIFFAWLQLKTIVLYFAISIAILCYFTMLIVILHIKHNTYCSTWKGCNTEALQYFVTLWDPTLKSRGWYMWTRALILILSRRLYHATIDCWCRLLNNGLMFVMRVGSVSCLRTTVNGREWKISAIGWLST